jgi:hypothetical protein
MSLVAGGSRFPGIIFIRTNSYRDTGSYKVEFCADQKLLAHGWIHKVFFTKEDRDDGYDVVVVVLMSLLLFVPLHKISSII